ncbi:MAG: glycoside hydrolase family 2 TIM barrel-domain containing protein [Elusimicrobiota bacterium]
MKIYSRIQCIALALVLAGTAAVFSETEYSTETRGVSGPAGQDDIAETKEVIVSTETLKEPVIIRGRGRVSLVKANGTWQLLVDKQTYIVKGVEYAADPVGRPSGESNMWMNDDFNGNGKCDGPYDSWIDSNGDNYQDLDEKPAGDFMLLKRMGCNTIRLYHPSNINAEILNDLYGNYGIMTIMGNLLGAYTVDTGAGWEKGTDYNDPAQREKMKKSVEEMVLRYKDEPFVLMWILGNENDAAGSYDNSTFNNTNAGKCPEAYARFVGEVARMIKRLDPEHPVGTCVAYYKLLPYFAKYAPEIDVIGMNAYTGPFGFGTLWGRVSNAFDRPVLITEYGADSYNQANQAVDEDFQALYHARSWQDIVDNSYAGHKNGNAIGGVAFCWMDKWWLCGSPLVHDAELGAWPGPSNDGKYNDEWIGICGQGDGSKSPFIRRPKKVYFTYKNELWNKSLEQIEESNKGYRKNAGDGLKPQSK